ncbi:MAG: response regulator [Magnetococcales bacterium]|nr:response regulator [Magnetococcales bacterium]
MRVLIVDDEFNNRMLLQKLLAEHGDCDIVVDGREAVDAFLMAHEDSDPYQLICMDIMMPEMTGNQAVVEIRRKERELGIPTPQEAIIIMTSALDSPKEVMKAYFKSGCTDYLVKPITPDMLAAKLKEYKLI